MNPILKQLVEEGKSFSLDQKQLVSIAGTSISKEEGDLIYRAVKETKSEVSIETGLAYGTSALWICEGLTKTPNTKHIVIDPYQHTEGTGFRSLGINNLQLAGYGDIIDFREDFSHLVLPTLERSGLKIDFGFIDGNHLYDYTLIDFFYMDRMLRKGGIIVIDDCNWNSIRKVCSFILTNKAYTVWDYIKSDFTLTPQRKLLNKFYSLVRTNKYLHTYFQPPHAVYGELLDQISYGGCIAFRKEADETRHWTDYYDF
jgi:predicted O-methyltransferase YrrM